MALWTFSPRTFLPKEKRFEFSAGACARVSKLMGAKPSSLKIWLLVRREARKKIQEMAVPNVNLENLNMGHVPKCRIYWTGIPHLNDIRLGGGKLNFFSSCTLRHQNLMLYILYDFVSFWKLVFLLHFVAANLTQHYWILSFYWKSSKKFNLRKIRNYLYMYHGNQIAA